MQVSIVPNLRTKSGETSDIMLDDQYAGTMTLVYREFDRISGSVQLDKEALTITEKDHVSLQIREYVQALIDAIDAQECDILVSYGELDHVITTPAQEELDMDEDEWEYDVIDTETQLEDGEQDELQMTSVEEGADEFNLVVVDEKDGRIEYHIIDQHSMLAAEVIAVVRECDVVADIVWEMLPSDQQIQEVTELLVSDFDEEAIETFHLDMKYKDRTIETIQLAQHRLVQKGWSEDSDPNMNQEYH